MVTSHVILLNGLKILWMSVCSNVGFHLSSQSPIKFSCMCYNMYLTYHVFIAGRCFMLFLIKLWNHHLVDGATVDKCLTVVDSYTPPTELKQALGNDD